MAAMSHLEIHREHFRWRAQNDMWRDDVALWETAVEEAIDQLPNLKKALHKHLDALRRHAAAIRLNEQEVNAHEHAISEYERGGAGEELIEMAKQFDHSAESVARQKHTHEELKRQHHDLMSSWHLLTSNLLEPQSIQQHLIKT